MTMITRPSPPLVASVVACCLFGLLSGCNSSSTSEVGPGQVGPRLKKFQDAKSKVDAAKK